MEKIRYLNFVFITSKLNKKKYSITNPNRIKANLAEKYQYDVTTSAKFAYKQSDWACRSTHSAGSSSDFRQSMKTWIVSANSFTLFYSLVFFFFFVPTGCVFIPTHLQLVERERDSSFLKWQKNLYLERNEIKGVLCCCFLQWYLLFFFLQSDFPLFDSCHKIMSRDYWLFLLHMYSKDGSKFLLISDSMF